MGKKINIRPTTSVYATYKNINYQIWTAIAEFVDNSTQSFYSNKENLEKSKYWKGLDVEINYKQDRKGEYYLEIRDNAFGMDFQDFQRAIILDSKPKYATRNEFGMGLKTAACWFGLKWSVESTALESPIKYVAEVDVEDLRKYKKEEIEVEEVNCKKSEHGTIIKIWDLNRSIAGRSIGKTKMMLAGMYRVDLRTSLINIYYNDEALQFREPEVYKDFSSDGNENEWKKEISFNIEHDGQDYNVKGFIGIRKRGSISEAGFTLIRRGRVIVGGYENNYRPKEVFGDSNSFEWQRLYGELNMDEWPVVQTKDNFDWNNGLEDSLIEKLQIECKEYIIKAQSIRVRKKVDANRIIEKTAHAFEKRGVISNVLVEDYKETIEKKHQEDRTLDIDNSEFGSDKDNSVIFENDDAKSISFVIANVNYKFNLILDRINDSANWLKITHKDQDYIITWNVNHPFFKKFMDNPDFVLVMQEFIFAFAISEVEAGKFGKNGLMESSNIRERMNDILTQIGDEVF